MRVVRRRRRASRQRERTPLAIAGAIPPGSTRVRRLSTYVELVDAHAEKALVRIDRRERLRLLALALLERASHSADGTTMPTWAFLEERLGCHRSTVARLLALLRSWGLLGVVATGRSAACAPGGPLARTKAHHSAAKDYQGGQNEAAIYVLCQPRPLVAVDTNATPPPERANALPRTHARSTSVPQSEPLRGPNHQRAAQARPEPHQRDYRPGRWYSPTATISGKDAAMAASRELQARVPALYRISDRHVRSVLREFFLAGWTVADVILAVDRRPTGQPWPHDGAHSVDNVGAWLAHRLKPWRTASGTVRRSPSQHAAAIHTETLARQRAERERRHQLRAQIATEPRHEQTREEVMAWVRANRGRWTQAPFSPTSE